MAVLFLSTTLSLFVGKPFFTNTMTMEDRLRVLERGAPVTSAATNISSSNLICDDGSSDASYPLQRASKRTFDVAFLVAPDENLARRQSEKLRLVVPNKLSDVRNGLPEGIQNVGSVERSPKYLIPKQFDTNRRSHECTENSLSPTCVSPRTLTTALPGLSTEPDIQIFSSIKSQKSSSPLSFSQQRQHLSGRCVNLVDPITLTCENSCRDQPAESISAFRKVSLNTPRNGFDDGQTSPRSSISPDRTRYQGSVSPPALPITGNAAYKYASFPTKMSYPFIVRPDTQQVSLMENLKIPQSPRIPSPKLVNFRPELPQVYSNLSYNPISVFAPMTDALSRPRFLATAASVAGLIPPSFAALSLPAQNVCAKCNLSFRMTSDLVYHMRSHHKNESAGESARRRREEKLRCPVCDESFRERHHLTRHMTAHQDKESDAIADQVEVKRRTVPIHSK